MAQIASVNGSIANALPSSQIPPTAPDANNAVFLALLTQAASSTNNAPVTDQGGTSTTNGADASSVPVSNTAENKLESQIETLLNSGVSLDSVTKTIATKLVSLSGASSGPEFTTKVNTVAQYLRQGESANQSAATTAKSIAGKVRALVKALDPPATATSTNTDSGNILDALQAGETPTIATATTPAVAHITLDNSNTVKQSQPPAQAAPAQPVAQTAQPIPPVSVQSAFTQALQALQNAPQIPTVPAASNVPAPNSAPVSASPQADSSSLPAANSAAVSAGINASAITAPAVSTPQPPAQPAPPSNAQPTLGQLSVNSTLQVATDLSAIASGQGTALSRALIRAANVDVSRSVSSSDVIDATLSSLSASLEDLLTSNASPDESGGKNLGQSTGAPGDTSLSDAAYALANSSSNTNQTTFSSALAKTQAPVTVDDIMDQVVNGLSIKNFRENPTVNISLNPQHLGELKVKLSVTDSTVNATVITQSSDVKAILLNNREQLDQTLANAGLKLGSLTVDVSGQGLQQEADRRQSQREQVFTAGTGVSQLDSTPDDTTQPSSGPSLLGSVDLSLLNQLV